MALRLSASEAEAHLHQLQQTEHVARTRQAAEWISNREDGSIVILLYATFANI